LCILITIMIMVLLFSSFVSTLQPSANAANGPSELSLDGLPAKGNPKLDSTLNSLVSDSSGEQSGFLTSQEGLSLTENTIRVIIESSLGQSDEILPSLATMGTIESTYGNDIQMVVPVSNITQLAEISSINKVRVPILPLVSTVTSEGVPLINADDWQDAGYDGGGVKMGILDVGFAGYTSLQSAGELPSSISTWWAPGIGNEGTESHGAACAEIIYDIAPGATYYFANFSTIVEYGNAVDWMIAQGVEVISCSVNWPT
jgi:hypothetical protein